MLAYKLEFCEVYVSCRSVAVTLAQSTPNLLGLLKSILYCMYFRFDCLFHLSPPPKSLRQLRVCFLTSLLRSFLKVTRSLCSICVNDNDSAFPSHSGK